MNVVDGFFGDAQSHLNDGLYSASSEHEHRKKKP